MVRAVEQRSRSGLPEVERGPEGAAAPARIRSGAPSGIVLAAPVVVTPTFVLVERGREVGRITGYPGADFFWGLLDGLLKKLEAEAPLKGG